MKTVIEATDWARTDVTGRSGHVKVLVVTLRDDDDRLLEKKAIVVPIFLSEHVNPEDVIVGTLDALGVGRFAWETERSEAT